MDIQIFVKNVTKKYRQSISKELYQKKKHKLNTNIQFKLAERINSFKIGYCCYEFSTEKIIKHIINEPIENTGVLSWITTKTVHHG